MASPSSVAQLAAQHVELAISTLVEVLQNGGRYGEARVEAARLMLELAAHAPASSANAPPDQLAAERARRRRATHASPQEGGSDV